MMQKFFIYITCSILFLGCVTTKPIPTDDTLRPVIIHDTIRIHDTTERIAYIFSDTSLSAQAIKLLPVSGDNYQQIQDAITYCRDNNCKVQLVAGYYLISQPLILAKINGLDYGQVSLDIEGPQEAKNAPDGRLAIIAPMFYDRPAFIVQRGKGVNIKNLSFRGQYSLPNAQTPYSIQTMRVSDWDDHKSNPYYAAIAVDPFSDPVYGLFQYDALSSYYLQGMSRAGSTGVNVIGCAIRNFVVGVIYEPGAQQNGDECNVIDCTIEYCKTGIAWCQDQTKGNYVRNLRCWGGVQTLFDCNSYGRGIGCMGYIDGVNIAGFVYQLFNCQSAGRFTASANGIYAETLFKIGVIGGSPVPTISNSTFDFMDFGFAPDYYVFGNANFEGCQFRIYNGQVNKINVSGFRGAFRDGAMEYPISVSIANGGTGYGIPKFDNVYMMDANNYWLTNNTVTKTYVGAKKITINPNYTAFVDATNLSIGDYVLAGEENSKYYDSAVMWNYNCPTIQLGRVIAINGSLATLDQVAINAKFGFTYYCYKN